jgi:two-component system LytT family response regulator
MKKLSCIIVDDEPVARKILQEFIEQVPFLDLLGKFENAMKAEEFLKTNQPRLIFLDIEMPKVSGLQMLKRINIESMVILTTAFPQYALDGYEFDIIDYLLKPFDRERFQTALTRALERIKQRGDKSQGERQAAVLAELKGPSKPLERLAIKSEGRVLFVRLEDINWIEAAHNYVEVHDEKQGHLVRDTVQGIEAKLPPEKFVRISRSVIVNISKIKEMQPLFYGEYTVTLHSGKKLTLSRRYRKKLPALGLG